ncbi:MAG: hypothetical protein KGL39_55815 [Patescibacteria group bacterium]|nr:hypothetical protein [Patescibacteria group bacterium]
MGVLIATTAVVSGYPLGINLAQVNYSSTEQPFINLMKWGGQQQGVQNYTGWITHSATTFDTNEWAYLQLDADGYPTSLTASPTPPGGQKFTSVECFLANAQVNVGGSGYYPAGTYRLKFIGQGTVTIGGDGSATLSNAAANTYVSTTFTVTPSSGGLVLSITAIGSNTDYPRDISVVLDSLAASYDAGAIFNPTFLAAIANFKSLRVTGWLNVGEEWSGFDCSGTIASGATSGTLSTAWIYPSGTYPIYFNNGQRVLATMTLGSTAFSWNTAVTAAITNTAGSQTGHYFYVSWFDSAFTRSKPSNAFWSLQTGVPLEVCVAVCNQAGADFFGAIPLAWTDAQVSAANQGLIAGTGFASGYSALNSGLSCHWELSNEVWNGVFTQYAVCGYLGGGAFPTQASGGGNYGWNRNYFGMRTAQIAAQCQTDWGAQFSRCIPMLGAQAAATTSATMALQTTYWTSGPASNYPIKAVCIAPYFGGVYTTADATTMLGVATPLDDFFACMTSQTGTTANGSKSYAASVPAGGWIAGANSWTSAYVSMLATSYPSLLLMSYEGGQTFIPSDSQNGGVVGFGALVSSAETDARMGTATATYLTDWRTTNGATASQIFHYFYDAGQISGSGAWGALQTVMETISPLSSAPPKYQALQNYISAG